MKTFLTICALSLCAAPVLASEIEECEPGVEPVSRYSPVYPRFRSRHPIEGWAEIGFIVEIDGTVRDVEVLKTHANLNPKKYGKKFGTAAAAAVKKFRYAPPPAECRTSFTITFAIQD